MPPNFKNHGNEVVSVSALARYQQRPRRGGRRLRPHRDGGDAVDRGGRRVVGVRSGDKGRGKEGEELRNFEPGADIRARVTVLAEGCWGHLTGAAIKEFELGDKSEPQVWELGVKEVWKVTKPLDRVIHTLGPWPLKVPARYGHVGGTWLYPMKDAKTGDDLVSIGFVVDLDYADATTSAHDLLQQFKLHPLVKGILEGGERVAWGAKALPGGGYWSMPKLTMPGALLVGDAGGMVDAVALKGVHHCINSGKLAAEAIYSTSLEDGQPIEPTTSTRSRILGRPGLYQVRNTRRPFQKGFVKRGPAQRRGDHEQGQDPPRPTLAWHTKDTAPMFVGTGGRLSQARRQVHVRQALQGLHHRQRHP